MSGLSAVIALPPRLSRLWGVGLQTGRHLHAWHAGFLRKEQAKWYCLA